MPHPTVLSRAFFRQALCLVIALLCLFPGKANAGLPAKESTVAMQPPVSLQPHPQPYTLEADLAGMPLTRERNWRSLNRIYEFDRAPLGTRIPVVLVPGRAEEFQQNSWWRAFDRISGRDNDFACRFKVYVFLYNSKAELDEQARELDAELRRRFSRLPKTQPLMLVTYSLGGVIARDVMADPGMLARIDTQVAISVPFHGSPLFDPDWFSQYLNPPNRSPIRRAWDRLIYRTYMFRKSNLTRGLKWDDFDGSKPQFNAQQLQLASDPAASVMPPYQDYPQSNAIRAKTIVYASYLENGYTKSNQPFNPLKLPGYVLDKSVKLPKELVATVLPIYGFTVHSVMTYMNHQMANIPTYTPEDPQGKNTHLYRFNDGAIPLSSMLFLPPRLTPYEDDLQVMTTASTMRRTRIFVNLDHLHMGEYTINKGRLVKPDLLHPEDGSRSPHRWIIKDLKERLSEIRG